MGVSSSQTMKMAVEPSRYAGSASRRGIHSASQASPVATPQSWVS